MFVNFFASNEHRSGNCSSRYKNEQTWGSHTRLGILDDRLFDHFLGSIGRNRCWYHLLIVGLTIGLMSIDPTNLSILKASGTPKEKKYAARIEPIRQNTHLLLVTLLLVNTVVNETLPILFDAIHFTGWKAVLSSTALIVVFGEILPQAICSRHGLRIGAFFAWPVRILIWIMWILSYPIATLLDWVLGHKGGVVYRHAGLKELVSLHGEDQSGPLSADEVTILRAVLDLRSKTVKDVMTPLEDVYMLEISQKLDRQTAASLVRAGHSRVPVYINDRQHILGALLVKQLIVHAPDDEIPISAIKLRKLPRVISETPLFEMLHIFEAGQSHMALIVEEANSNGHSGVVADVFVTNSPNWQLKNPSTESTRHRIIGILTLEDVIEELIGEEVLEF
jgi:metal transporter CNNM